MELEIDSPAGHKLNSSRILMSGKWLILSFFFKASTSSYPHMLERSLD